MQKISGAEYPLRKIFSNDFDFMIPSYQRPYAWTTEEAGELFDDIKGFIDQQADDDPYFLGSIVLIKNETDSRAEVIDGQQRLTTLTILLSVLLDKLTDDRGKAFAQYINEPGNIVEELEPKPRLALRERDREFFRQYIQTEDKLAELFVLDPANLNDPQKNIQANARLFVNRLKALDHDEAFKLGKFVINRCYLVAVSTPNMQSAYRIFSVLNNRGLDLLPSDILKADIIGAVPESHRERYTDEWEGVEETLGRDAFNALFGHIRMIYQKGKAKKTLLEEFREHVIPQGTEPKKFIDEVLCPYADAYQIVMDANYQSSRDASKVNHLLQWLQRLDNADWISPTIAFMHKYKNQLDLLERFYGSLERLAASLFIMRYDINQRIDRYAQLINAIEKDYDLWAGNSPLMLTDVEKRNTLTVLDGDIYNMNRVRMYVMLRLDAFLSDQAAVYQHKILTVEHVLPQTVLSGSYWEETWPDTETRAAWVHRLGNLLLLSRRKNSEASNYDFTLKKEKYFRSQNGVSSFALTTTVLEKDAWTPAIVANRQEAMLRKLKHGWELE